ncbi:uncharacterized protein LOC128240590 [Mya arenaria]|nr:uncharacterized protein LOC128240590 [Mya arenaria]
MSQFISLDEMIQQAKSQCPEGTAVPSKSLVRLQFAPKNPFTKIATTFTSKLNVQYKIQKRQLRVAHPDEHFCNAQFRYMKECAIENKEKVKLLFCDDKAKVPFGNPGALLSTGVRGKKTIVPVTSTLSALDHDMQSSGSLTPSVYLDCQIPDSPVSSFVRGQVTVIVNDSVFKASSPMRHAAAIVKLLTMNEQVPPLLFKFTDGGCDQRNTLESVKCASVCIFKELNLDMIVLGRCAPNHSYVNPAERVMSILNLGLQNVALERKPCEDENIEKLLGQCNSMADIREKSAKNPGLKQSWEAAVEELTTTLGCRFSRLKLKDKPFNVLNPVTEEEIDILQRHLRQLFPDLDLSKVNKATTSKSEAYKAWMSQHARSRNYTFQLRKCSDSSCCLPSTIPRDELLWLPDPVLDEEGYHYKPYSDVKGAETNDDNRPSLIAKQQKQQHKPSTQQPVQHDETEDRDPEMPTNEPSLCSVQNARAVVSCSECRKPRVIYSKHKLSERQKMSLVL